MITASQISALQGGNPYGVSMTVGNPDPFFGPIGSLIMQALGLSVPGYDGSMSPIFRSNIFGGRDPLMSGNDYLMSGAYTSRINNVNARFNRQLAASIGDMLGGKTGRSGVGVSGRVGSSDFIRSIATSQAGTSVVNSMLNSFLGYDRGAAGNILAQNIDSILARTPEFQQSMYGRDSGGNLIYYGADTTSDNYQRARASGAAAMMSSLQRTMYSDAGGFTKNWSVSHGISEELAGRIISDAARSGAYSKKSEMSDRDKGLFNKVSKVDSDIEAEERKILNSRKLLDDEGDLFTDSARERARKTIDESRKKIRKLKAVRDSYESEISTYSYDGNLNDIIDKLAENDKKAQKIVKGLGSEDDPTSLYGRQKALREQYEEEMKKMGVVEGKTPVLALEEAKRKIQPIVDDMTKVNGEVENAKKELDKIAKSSEDLSKRLDPVTKAIVKDVSSAVDTAKAIFGTENESYEALYKMTGGHISNPGVARSLDMRLQQFLESGTISGLSNGAMGQMLSAAIGTIASGRSEVGEPYKNDYYSAMLGIRASDAAARAMGANDLTDAERSSLGDAALWLATTNDQSSTMNAANLVQIAYEEGSLGEKDYKDIMYDLKSGNDTVRENAFRRYASIVFNGDVEAAADFMNDPVKMALIRDRVKNKDAVQSVLEDSANNETNDAKELAEAMNMRDEAVSFFTNHGVSGKWVSDNANTASSNAAIAKMQELAPTDERVRFALSTLNKLRDSWSEEERDRKTVDWLNSTGFSSLGDAGNEVKLAVLGGTTDALNSRLKETLETSVGNGLSDVLGEGSDALDKQGRLTVKNLLKVANVAFGDTMRNNLTPEQQKAFDKMRREFYSSTDSGDYEAAASKLNEFSDSLGVNDRNMLGYLLDDTVSFSETGVEAGETNAIQDAVQFLADRGEDITTASINGVLNSDLLHAGRDPAAEQRRAERRRKMKEAAANGNQPGAETFLDFLHGDTSFVNVFKNPDVTDKEFYERTGKLFNLMGWAESEGQGMGIMDLFTKGGATEVSAHDLVSSMKDVISQGGGRELSKLLGVDIDSDAFNSTKMNADRQRKMQSILKDSISETTRQRDNLLKLRSKEGELSEDDEDRLKGLEANLAKFQESYDLVTRGKVDLGGEGKTQDLRSDKEKRETAIPDLIDRIDSLITALGMHFNSNEWSF